MNIIAVGIGISNKSGTTSKSYLNGEWTINNNFTFTLNNTFGYDYEMKSGMNITRQHLSDLKTNNLLIPGWKYTIINHEGDNGLIIEATSENTLDGSNCTRLALVPRYYQAGTYTSETNNLVDYIWNSSYRNESTFGTVLLNSYSVHKGKVYKKVVDEKSSTLDPDTYHWLQMDLHDSQSVDFYKERVFTCNYDFTYDNIISQTDEYDNTYGGKIDGVFVNLEQFFVDYNDWVELSSNLFVGSNSLLRFSGNYFASNTNIHIMYNSGTGYIADNAFTTTCSIKSNTIDGKICENLSIASIEYNNITINGSIESNVSCSVLVGNTIGGTISSCTNLRLHKSIINSVLSNKTFTATYNYIDSVNSFPDNNVETIAKVITYNESRGKIHGEYQVSGLIGHYNNDVYSTCFAEENIHEIMRHNSMDISATGTFTIKNTGFYKITVTNNYVIDNTTNQTLGIIWEQQVHCNNNPISSLYIKHKNIDINNTYITGTKYLYKGDTIDCRFKHDGANIQNLDVLMLNFLVEYDN